MKYRPFFNLEIVHDYYIDHRCPDFQIEPTSNTKKLLRDCQCVLKFFLNGVTVLTHVTDDVPAKPFIPPPAGAAFCFRWRLKNPDFCLFTDSSGFAQRYANKPTTQIPMHQLEPVPDSSNLGLQRDALAEIKYNSATDVGEDVPTFQVRFKPLEAKWKYYIVTEKADALTVEDSDNVIRFVASEATPDKIASELARQYPKMHILRFVSENPVPCHQAARTGIQLKKDNETLIQALPNPPLGNYAMDATQGYTLYQIITTFIH